MQAADRGGTTRQRHIDSLGSQLTLQHALIEGGPPCCERALQGVLDLIEGLPDRRPFGRRQTAKPTLQLAKRTFATQHFDSPSLERIQVGDLVKLAKGVGPQLGELLSHGRHFTYSAPFVLLASQYKRAFAARRKRVDDSYVTNPGQDEAEAIRCADSVPAAAIFAR